MTPMGTKFASVTGSNAVTQFDKVFNVKFRANKLRNRLALDGQVQTLLICDLYLTSIRIHCSIVA